MDRTGRQCRVYPEPAVPAVVIAQDFEAAAAAPTANTLAGNNRDGHCAARVYL